jgi:ABC-type sugar transport system substrate-binding protein
MAGLAGLVVASLALGACSGGGSAAPTEGAGATDAPSSPAKQLTVGVSFPTSNNVFWDGYMNFVKDGGEQLGITIDAVSADNSEQKQVADIESLIAKGVDGLIITPQSTAIAKRLLTLTTTAKIPVVVTDRYPGYEPGTDPAADYVAFVGPNDEQAGQGIMDALVAAGVTKVDALGGLNGSSVAEGRKAGLMNSLEANSAVTLVDYQAVGESQDLGQAAMENLLAAHPSGSVDGVWCYNDSLCMGAIKAAQNAGRISELKIGGMDLNPDALDAVKAGTYTVTFGGHWLQGGFGLVILYDSINGKAPKETLVKLNLLKVDASNLSKFMDQYRDNPPEYDFKQLSQVTNPNASATFDITLK